MLSINIHPVMKARDIDNPFGFLVKSGFSRHSASNIVEGNLSNIKLEHIEKLCLVLICLPQDIFVWHPGKDDKIPADHPIHTLKPAEPLPEWKSSLKTLPYSQLKEVVKSIADTVKQ